LRQESRSAELLSRPAPAALFTLTLLILGSGAALAVYRAHADRMELATGKARWIWYSSRIPEPRALTFYATRDFLLPEAPARASAKVFVDREHVLYVNGERAGSGTQRPGDPIAVYEIGRFLRAGENRIAVEAASPTGVGGILVSVDVDGFGRDALVSDGLWRMDAEATAIASGGRYRPVVWGSPPQYPWGYPRMPAPGRVGTPD
jgi:hypothetical protein